MFEIVGALGLKSKTGALKRAVNDLLSLKYVEYTIPGKSSSRLQKYRLTRNGEDYLKKQGKKWGLKMAGRKGLEPSTSGLTGQRSNQAELPPPRWAIVDYFYVFGKISKNNPKGFSTLLLKI